jgi:CHAT domain-containing protein
MLFSTEPHNEGAEFVFLRELYDLDLSNVRLATISACDTERGKMIRGEGVQAFSRALLSSGARSSLTTMWRVEDQATAEFMRQFYFFVLEKHTPTAEALRLAKLKFLHSNTPLGNPRFWAAFVLNGDGFTPLPAVITWSGVVLKTLALLAVIALVVWGLRLGRGRRLHGKHFS